MAAELESHTPAEASQLPAHSQLNQAPYILLLCGQHATIRSGITGIRLPSWYFKPTTRKVRMGEVVSLDSAL